MEEGGFEAKETELQKLLGSAWFQLRGRELGRKGAVLRFADFCKVWGETGVGPFKIHPPPPLHPHPCFSLPLLEANFVN